MGQGERLKELRKRDRVSQKDLAIALNTTQSNISAIENNTINISRNLLFPLSEFFNVDPGWLTLGEASGRDINEPAGDYSKPNLQVLQLDLHIKNNKVVQVATKDISDNDEVKEMIKENSKSIKALAELLTSKL